MKAVICPVCNGSGMKYYESTPPESLNTSGVFKTCHGCGGKGWVEVSHMLAPKRIEIY
jgi:uncharacterized protein with PIN domain